MCKLFEGHIPTIERSDRNHWIIDGVFVDITSHYWIDDKEARYMFWLGIDSSKPINSDTLNVVNQIIADNDALGITVDHVMNYVDHGSIVGIGLQHTGLSFTWNWIVTEEWSEEWRKESGRNKSTGRNKCFVESEKRALDSICRLITLLKSQGVPLSEQHPYSFKNTWLNHFRPAVEHLMSLGTGFWLPALTLSIPCIDAAYQDWYKQRHGNAPNNPYTEAMLRWLFDPDSVFHEHERLNKAIDLLRDGLANGLKHDTLIRDPITLYNPYLILNHNEPPEFSVRLGDDETRTIFTVRVDSSGAESVMVFPSLWWETVRNRIDRHYKLL